MIDFLDLQQYRDTIRLAASAGDAPVVSGFSRTDSPPMPEALVRAIVLARQG